MTLHGSEASRQRSRFTSRTVNGLYVVSSSHSATFKRPRLTCSRYPTYATAEPEWGMIVDPIIGTVRLCVDEAHVFHPRDLMMG
jgi:hypothetical protein